MSNFKKALNAFAASIARDPYEGHPIMAKITVNNFLMAVISGFVCSILTSDTAIEGFVRGMLLGSLFSFFAVLLVPSNLEKVKKAVDSEKMPNWLFWVITIVSSLVILKFVTWPMSTFGGADGAWASLCMTLPGWTYTAIKAYHSYEQYLATVVKDARPN